MPPINSIDVPSLVAQEAQAQGVPPALALAVANAESGIAQWTPNGNLVTSSAGAQGVFQLMPSTAAGLGVDPTDVNENIQGGITYLAQLFQQFGNWPQALAAYNWGPGNVANNPNSIPSSVSSYVNGILASAGLSASNAAPTLTDPLGLTDPDIAPPNGGVWILVGIAAAVALGIALLD